MPLGTEVGLEPGDIVLDGDPAILPTERGTEAPTPTFRPRLLWHGAHLSNCWALVNVCLLWDCCYVLPLHSRVCIPRYVRCLHFASTLPNI